MLYCSISISTNEMSAFGVIQSHDILGMLSRIPTIMTLIYGYVEVNKSIISIQPLRLTWDNDYIFYCTYIQEKMLHCSQ